MSSRIEPVPGEPFRFQVSSESRDGLWFLVDLQANRFNGFCGCEDFQARRGVILRDHDGARSPLSRCKHIQSARDYLLDRFLERLAEQTGLVEEAIS